MTAVELPVPPSANHLWRCVSRGPARVRVVKSKAYSAWLEAAVFLLRAGMPAHGPGPHAVRLTVVPGRGWDARRDLDNAIKPVLDALVWAGRIPGDSHEYVREVLARIGPPARDAACLVAVAPLEP